MNKYWYNLTWLFVKICLIQNYALQCPRRKTQSAFICNNLTHLLSSYNQSRVYSQQTIVSTQIKTSVPDFLLSFIDGIIRLDRCGVLRYQYLHYPIDILIANYQVPDASLSPLWIFLNPYGSSDLQASSQQNKFFTESKDQVIENTVGLQHKSSEVKSCSPRKDIQSLVKLEPSKQAYQKLQLQPNRKLEDLLASQGFDKQLGKLRVQQFTNIDIIRLYCEANTYFDPQEIIIQIRRIIAWNQFYRASSKKSYQYLSRIFQGMLDLIEKKNFLKKFYDQKAIDLERISKAQPNLKINIEEKLYPIIPQNFRQYEQLDDYQPSPQNRKQIIEKRLKSSKQPIKCPQNCVCIMGSEQEQTKGRSFCSYTLSDGWITQCPNRLRKVECRHQNADQMAKCKNAQIKKGERKKCKAYQSQTQENYDLQECIAWGIDLSTRIMIYYSLPQIDIEFMDRKQNSDNRNHFIEKILLKAANFNDKEGYSIKKVCQYIISNSQNLSDIKQEETLNPEKTNVWKARLVTQNKQKIEQKKYLFTLKNRFYARNLLKNYELCKDQSVYRIHTKGKGVKCINKRGIEKGRFIVEYYGQLYEPWRWYQKQDFIKESLKKKKLKNIIPQFYNIYLQKHKDEPNGYDIMVVDPIRKGNFSSRFSHSCDPNCGTIITVSEGRYHIGMYSFRDIEYGEELSFDYCSVTQSNYQHQNSICLCGMKKCRGNYLQLINSKANNVIDKNNCFHFRNATILRSLQALNQDQIKLCESHGIKLSFLKELPQWMGKWMALIIKFMEEQCQSYKKYLIQKWTENYEWETKLTTPQQKQKNIQLYAQSFKSQLFGQRFQNLFTTLDKLKYYTQSIKDQSPPLNYSQPEKVASALITVKNSVFEEIMDVLIQFYSSSDNTVMQISNQDTKQKHIQVKQQAIAFIAKQFKQKMNQPEDPNLKLFFFRLSCLLISHLVLRQKPKNTKRKFSYTVFSDIVYFYAFTHTFFTPHDYDIFTSQPINIWVSQILGGKRDSKPETTKKKYSSQFIWGQLVSWFKQTIVSPEASLSQDRRGTLSLPTIPSTKFTMYPFEGHNRKSFLKSLRQRPATSWPPSEQCSLSYKNTYKCYGTILFQSHFNKEVFKELPRGSLLDSAIQFINLTLRQKMSLFKKVELLLHKTPQDSPLYNQFLDKIGFSTNFLQNILDEPLPQQIIQPILQEKKRGSKKRKSNQNAQQE